MHWGCLVVLQSTMSKKQNRRMAIIVAALFVIALLCSQLTLHLFVKRNVDLKPILVSGFMKKIEFLTFY